MLGKVAYDSENEPNSLATPLELNDDLESPTCCRDANHFGGRSAAFGLGSRPAQPKVPDSLRHCNRRVLDLSFGPQVLFWDSRVPKQKLISRRPESLHGVWSDWSSGAGSRVYKPVELVLPLALMLGRTAESLYLRPYQLHDLVARSPLVKE